MADARPPVPNQPPGGAAAAYRVLARKYRPSSFDDLVGQSAMVRTVSNAFETGRIPQAWILTGVRGVGKTTTARILARALNYELADGSVQSPTIHMPQLGVNCQAIMEGRHIDVLEMDAASHTGIDDVRQINDSVRYAPASARYKVYIIDEVHMLSTAAFNAFLKTLEEPPPHAKFVFATTEIRKVPITVLSRCQRFDLRRVEASVLIEHLGNIAGKEGIEAEAEALGLIARAAEGSVRDSLSLFDQAIAHAAGPVRAEDIRQMLGLADRTRVISLFDALARGDIAAAFDEFRDQYDTGADPAVVLTDLAEFVNLVTRIKVVPATSENVALGETERLRGREFASKLSMRVLSRMWQMLLKGIAEVQTATRPAAAAEMVLVRIAYAADLPTPDEVIRALDDGSSSGGGARPSPSQPAPRSPVTAGTMAQPATGRMPSAPSSMSSSTMSSSTMSSSTMSSRGASEPARAQQQPQLQTIAAPSVVLNSFADVVALAAAKRDIQMKTALEADIRLVRMEDGKLELALETHAPKTLVNELARKLEQWTGRRWLVVISTDPGQPTLRAQAQVASDALKRGAESDPRVRAVLERFPGAEVVEVRRAAPETPDLGVSEVVEGTGEDDD